MGRESLCHAELGPDAGDVRAMLESHELRLSGAFKASVRFEDLRRVNVSAGVLEAYTPHGLLRLALGETEARKWLDRIGNAPSLAQKLGIGPGVRAHVLASHPMVSAVLLEAGVSVAALADASVVFSVVEDHTDLETLGQLVSRLPVGVPLWVLRKKGKQAVVKEREIMEMLRARGLAPSKTTAWSDSHGADRYGRARSSR